VDMDSLDTSDLIEVVLATQAYVGSQFEYWLTVSFAAIVAGAVAGDRLGPKARVFLVFLYLLATAVLTLEIFQAAQTARVVGEELFSRGLTSGGPNLGLYQFAIRMLLFLSGTIGTCWFLINGGKILSKEST
jgi:hypothetical protein